MNIKNKLKMVNISDIRPYEKNAKKHSRAQIELIKKSLKKNDYYAPIGVDSNNIIVVGHGRYLAMSELDPEQKIEVIDFSYLKKKEIKKLRILDNKSVSNDYDKDLLQEEIESLYKDIDDAKELGFSDKDLERVLGEFDEKPEVEFTEELLEAQNYVVLTFDNEIDWLNAKTVLGLKSVKALDSKKGFKKEGIGRVIKGSEIINRITNHENIG